jgi:hypothetical protein
MTVVNEEAEELPDIDIPDLNLPSVIELKEGILDMRDVPPKAATILGLRALGFSYGRVAQIIGTSRQNIQRYCDRYDPRGLCKISDADRRVLTTQMLMSTGLAALMEIDQEKLRTSDAKDLANIASRCATTAEKLRLLGKGAGGDRASRLDTMISVLEEGADEE